MNAILERIGKGREQITGHIEERIEALQKRKSEILDQGEKAVNEGRGRIRVLEANALEQALDLLVKANDKLEDRSSLLKRGEEALEELLVSVRAGQSVTLPIDGFDELSIKKIRPFIEDMDALNLRAIRAYETCNKNRVTLLREIDNRLEEIDS